MPKRLLQRCSADSVGEFRLAARQRFQDGMALAARGRRTAAIYLWGYAAEMTLKAACFSSIGFPPTQMITVADLRGARSRAIGLGVGWPGNLHDLRARAELLVLSRASTPGKAYAAPTIGNEVLFRGRALQRLWSEILRYHKNVAYFYEVAKVREAVEWLLANSTSL